MYVCDWFSPRIKEKISLNICHAHIHLSVKCICIGLSICMYTSSIYTEKCMHTLGTQQLLYARKDPVTVEAFANIIVPSHMQRCYHAVHKALTTWGIIESVFVLLFLNLLWFSVSLGKFFEYHLWKHSAPAQQ